MGYQMDSGDFYVFVNGYSPEPRRAAPGVLFYDVLIPHSEVCMHMRVAGERMTVQIVGTSERQAAQLYKGPLGNQVPFSAPILLEEAGILRATR